MNRTTVLLLALLPAMPAAAQEPGAAPPADLGALLREADERSPALRAAAARVEAARRAPSQALAPPDPEVSLAYTNDGLSRLTLGEREFAVLALTWTQEIPFPGKRGQRQQVAGFEAERAAREAERARLEVSAAVKAAYADLFRADGAAAILDETRSVLQVLAQTARRRYEVGQGSQENVLKAQTEIVRLEAERARVEQDRRAAEIRLNAAVGRPFDAPLGRVFVLPAVQPPADRQALVDEAVSASPEVGALQAAVEREAAAVRLARLGFKPDLVWSASYQNRGALDPMVTGMIGFRLPLHRERRQAQALLQAESSLEAARRDLEDGQVRVRAAVRELLSRLERAERLRALFGEGVVPQARMTLESAQASYGVGRVDFLDLLGDLNTLLAARAEHLAQEADRFQALAALEPLVAREIIRVPRPAAGGGR